MLIASSMNQNHSSNIWGLCSCNLTSKNYSIVLALSMSSWWIMSKSQALISLPSIKKNPKSRKKNISQSVQIVRLNKKHKSSLFQTRITSKRNLRRMLLEEFICIIKTTWDMLKKMLIKSEENKRDRIERKIKKYQKKKSSKKMFSKISIQIIA